MLYIQLHSIIFNHNYNRINLMNFFCLWIARSKPFQLKVRSNSDQKLNAENSQHGLYLIWFIPYLLFYTVIFYSKLEKCCLKIWIDSQLIYLTGFSLRYVQLPCVIWLCYFILLFDCIIFTILQTLVFNKKIKKNIQNKNIHKNKTQLHQRN
jgi:hypothetical protein